MKVFVVFSAILAVGLAKPNPSIALPHTGFIVPAGIQSKFHAQDELGQYTYGYNDALSAKQEVRSFDGTTRGSYSYVDAEGKLQSVDYTADHVNGFRVAATNLPKAAENIIAATPGPVVDTPEVARAKEAHFAALNEARIRVAESPVVLKSVETIEKLPKPVKDTPEVAKAKAEHLAAKKVIELRSGTTIPAVQTLHLASVPFAPLLRTAEFPRTFAYSVNGPFLSDSGFLTRHSIL